MGYEALLATLFARALSIFNNNDKWMEENC